MVSDISQLATYLDPRFPSNIIDAAPFLKSVMLLPTNPRYTPNSGKKFSNGSWGINTLLVERSEEEAPLQPENTDETTNFIHAKHVGDLNIDPLQCWSSNSSICSHLSSVVKS